MNKDALLRQRVRFFPEAPKNKSFTRFFSKNRRGPGGSAPGRWPQPAKHPPAAAGETPAPRTARNTRPPQRAKHPRRARRETPARRNGRNTPSVPKRHPQMAQSPGKAEGRRPHPVSGWWTAALRRSVSDDIPAPTNHAGQSVVFVGRHLCVPPCRTGQR